MKRNGPGRNRVCSGLTAARDELHAHPTRTAMLFRDGLITQFNGAADGLFEFRVTRFQQRREFVCIEPLKQRHQDETNNAHHGDPAEQAQQSEPHEAREIDKPIRENTQRNHSGADGNSDAQPADASLCSDPSVQRTQVSMDTLG